MAKRKTKQNRDFEVTQEEVTEEIQEDETPVEIKHKSDANCWCRPYVRLDSGFNELKRMQFKQVLVHSDGSVTNLT